jgi:hypothetical protein
VNRAGEITPPTCSPRRWTAGAATHASDLLVDLKTGYLLGGSPRKQFIAQFLGILAGSGFLQSRLTCLLVQARGDRVAALAGAGGDAVGGGRRSPGNGISYEERGPGAAVPAKGGCDPARQAVWAVRSSATSCGSRPDRARAAIEITMIDRAVLVVDGQVAPGKPGELYDAEIFHAVGRVARLRPRWPPACCLAMVCASPKKPEGACAGDYVLARVDGRDMYHRMVGIDGERGDARSPVRSTRRRRCRCW